ncbi:thiosulfate sulfurtransferase/rhodanese-like domain-containing protein 3 isoform X2 [Paroedura picta]|uniref:thiosulfate sulfurtransferase/rhodanese-like domain-containing protein 3 isoform X2 n=1 Tax=Paroedura picta TaxID=143630 RepID=UPI0040566259
MWRPRRLLSQVAALPLMTARAAGTVGMVHWLACRGNRSRGLLRRRAPTCKKLLCESRYVQSESIIVCHFSSAENHHVSYGELKGLLESKAIQLIDVREKWEIGEHGKIPGSINIPLGKVVEALQMNPEHFKKMYNEDMPSKSDHLVFFCMAGVRSKQAVTAAKSLGFGRNEVRNGCWTEIGRG